MQATLPLFTTLLVVLFTAVAVGTHLLLRSRSAKTAQNRPRLTKALTATALLSVMGWLSTLPVLSTSPALESRLHAGTWLTLLATLGSATAGFAFGVCTSLLDGMTNTKEAQT